MLSGHGGTEPLHRDFCIQSLFAHADRQFAATARATLGMCGRLVIRQAMPPQFKILRTEPSSTPCCYIRLLILVNLVTSLVGACISCVHHKERILSWILSSNSLTHSRTTRQSTAHLAGRGISIMQCSKRSMIVTLSLIYSVPGL